jgi:plasmid stability protein
MEDEVRDILRNAAKEENRPLRHATLATRNARYFADLKINVVDPWQTSGR